MNYKTVLSCWLMATERIGWNLKFLGRHLKLIQLINILITVLYIITYNHIILHMII